MDITRRTLRQTSEPILLQGGRSTIPVDVTLTMNSANLLRVCQRAMERAMMEVSLLAKTQNVDIKRKTGFGQLWKE